MAVRTSKRCFSTSPAAAVTPARPRNDRRGRRRDCVPRSPAGSGGRRPAPSRSDGAALSLSPALVVDAASGADLLAGGAVVRVGFPAVLHRAELRLLRPCQ